MLQTPQPIQCYQAIRYALALDPGTGNPRHDEPARESREYGPPKIDNQIIHQFTPHLFRYKEP